MDIEDLRQMIRGLVATRPELATRVEKAAALLLTRRIGEASGAWRVESQTKPGSFHLVNLEPERSCDCRDHRAPGGWCKHLLAVALVATLRKERERRRRLLADLVEEAAPYSEDPGDKTLSPK